MARNNASAQANYWDRISENRRRFEAGKISRREFMNNLRSASIERIEELRNAGVDIRDLPDPSQIKSFDLGAIRQLEQDMGRRTPENMREGAQPAPQQQPGQPAAPAAPAASQDPRLSKPAPGAGRGQRSALPKTKQEGEQFLAGMRRGETQAQAAPPSNQVPQAPQAPKDPIIEGVRSVPFGNGVQLGPQDQIRHTGAGFETLVQSESGPRWTSFQPSLDQIMAGKTNGQWTNWTPDQRREFLQGKQASPAQQPPLVPQQTSGKYGTVIQRPASPENAGKPGLVYENGAWRPIGATTDALRAKNDADAARYSAQQNNAQVEATAQAMETNPTTQAIAAEVNQNMGTNVTPESMRQNQTVPIPPVAQVNLPPAVANQPPGKPGDQVARAAAPQQPAAPVAKAAPVTPAAPAQPAPAQPAPKAPGKPSAIITPPTASATNVKRPSAVITAPAPRRSIEQIAADEIERKKKMGLAPAEGNDRGRGINHKASAVVRPPMTVPEPVGPVKTAGVLSGVTAKTAPELASRARDTALGAIGAVATAPYKALGAAAKQGIKNAGEAFAGFQTGFAEPEARKRSRVASTY